MRYHPDEFHVFEAERGKLVRSAIRRRAGDELVALLEDCSSKPEQLAAIAATLRIDDKLIVLHEDHSLERERNAFIHRVIDWCSGRGDAFEAEIGELAEQIVVIEDGYRSISRAIASLPISRRTPERQLSALIHHCARLYDEVLSLGPRSRRTADGATSAGAAAVVEKDGVEADVDAYKSGLAALLANAIGFLAFGRWSAKASGYAVPELPVPEADELDEADALFVFSLAWTRWQRWERQARYWRGKLQRFDGAAIPPDAPQGLVELVQHQRGSGDYLDWVSAQRLHQVQSQELHRLLRHHRRLIAEDPDIPPMDEEEVAQRLAATLVFGVAHLDPLDEGTYAGATLLEWLKGYSVLRRLTAGAVASGADATSRHVLRLSRGDILAHLKGAGLSPEGADAFVNGLTLRAGSVDLFDTPLIRQGSDGYLLLGPTAASVNSGRTLLSNLPNLKADLDGKGVMFEREVLRFFRSRGLDCFAPKRDTPDGEYQYDAIVHWNDTLFLFECKNVAPSNLHPKIAIEFLQRRAGDIRQVKRLVEGLRRYPWILTEESGPHPSRTRIIPVLLYAMPYARPGSEDGVFTTDWSLVSRFFERGDTGREVEFDVGKGRKPLVHRQPLQRIWEGDCPTPDDLVRALGDPWPLRHVAACTRLTWSYASLEPYRMARSVDLFAVDLTTEEAAEAYGLHARDLERDLQRARGRAAAIKRARERKSVLAETRRDRRRRRSG